VNSSRHIAQTSGRLLLQGNGARYRRVFIVDSAERCSALHRTMNAYSAHDVSRMNWCHNTIALICTRFSGFHKASCWFGIHYMRLVGSSAKCCKFSCTRKCTKILYTYHMYDMSALEVCSRQGAIQIHIHLYLLYTQHNGKLHGVIYLK